MSGLIAHLNAVIAQSGMGRGELSRRTGLAHTTLIRKLAGRGELTVTDLLRIARALGVRPSDLLPEEAAA